MLMPDTSSPIILAVTDSGLTSRLFMELSSLHFETLPNVPIIVTGKTPVPVPMTEHIRQVAMRNEYVDFEDQGLRRKQTKQMNKAKRPAWRR